MGLLRLSLALLFTFSVNVMAQTPDFSAVDSREKILALAQQGTLERVHLFPLEVGGQDIEANVVYLPVGFKEIKAKIDATIQRMAEEGLISKLTVQPEYKGNSFIPSRIVIKASHPDKPGKLDTTIEVW